MALIDREAIRAMRERRQAAEAERSRLLELRPTTDVISGECPTRGCGNKLFELHSTPRGLLFAAIIRPLPTDRGGMPWEHDAAMATLDNDTLDSITDQQLAAYVNNPARDAFGSTKWAPGMKGGYLVLDLIEEPSKQSGDDLPGLWVRCARTRECRTAQRLSPTALVAWSRGARVDPVAERRAPSTT